MAWCARNGSKFPALGILHGEGEALQLSAQICEVSGLWQHFLFLQEGGGGQGGPKNRDNIQKSRLLKRNMLTLSRRLLRWFLLLCFVAQDPDTAA